MTDRAGPFAALEEAAARQATEESATKAMAAARAALVLGRDAASAFFATLVLRLRCVADAEVGTMATDGRALRYAPAFVAALPLGQLRGVLAHEAMHCALGHPARRGHREPGRWNVACDLAVNPLLLAAGMELPAGRLVPGAGRYAHLPPGKAAEEYDALLRADDEISGDAADAINGGARTGGQASSSSPDPGGCGRVDDVGAGDPADLREIEAEWWVALAEATRAAAVRGGLPGGLARAAEAALEPTLDWRAVLREFVSAHARSDYSWSRPNRRFLHRGLYLPGLRSEELGDVIIAVDTSGSVGDELLARFAAEANAVLSSFECSVTVLYHDTEVQRTQSWTSADGPLELAAVGGGGTSHECVFDWLVVSGVAPSCVVCLTDLETAFPAVPPDVPVLWAVAGDPHGRRTAPFGRVVHLPS